MIGKGDWIALTETAYKSVWDRFYQDFSFKPSPYSHDWPSIKTHKPCFKFSLENLWNSAADDVIYDDLVLKAAEAFISVTSPGETVYALDWQHECYEIDPRKIDPSPLKFVSFMPDGDYSIFITKNFENVWFGHPWENTITVIGEKLIEHFQKSGPIFLQKQK